MSKRIILASIIFLTLVLAVLFFSFLSRKEIADENINVANVRISEEYQNSLRALFETYDKGQDANAAYEELLTIRVPSAEFQNTHLNLVILFDRLRKSDVKNRAQIEAELNTLRKENSF